MARAVRPALLAACALLSGTAVHAQTMQPLIAEYTEQARGRFEVVNPTLFPLNVVLEAYTFELAADGTVSFQPLGEDIDLRLSTHSFRLAPASSRTVVYETRTASLPAWFVIYARIAGLPQQSGMNIQLELPHTVYVYQKDALTAADVRLVSASFDAAAGRVVVELENLSGRLARGRGVEAGDARLQQLYGGFPLFPHATRRFELEWTEAAPPARVVIQFPRFNVAGSVEPAQP